MATLTTTPTGAGAFIQTDSAATANTVAQRDSSGNCAFAQVAGSELKSNGILTRKSVAKTTSFTADGTATDYECNATGGAIVPTLPPAASCTDRCYWFIKTDSSGNAVTVTGNGAELINGSNTLALAAQYNKTAIRSNGTQWYVVD